MEKTILFLILDQWADWEAAYLSSALRMLGQGQYSIKTVSLTKNSVESIGGFCVIPDYEIYATPLNYEGLILIGGMAWRNENTEGIKSLVHKCVTSGKVLGAICDASAFLGTTGVLNNINHTSNDLGELKRWAGKAYTGEEKYTMKQAVCDKNIITANGTAALEFAKEVMLALKAAPEDKIIEWFNFHKLGYYKAAIPQDASNWNE